MKTSLDLLKKIWSLGVISGLLLTVPVLQSCGNQSSGERATDQVTESTSGNASLRVVKDPVSGKLGPPPAGTSASLSASALNNNQGTLSVLKEVPNPAGSGEMVDLKGRFRKNLTAVKDADGKVTIIHRSESDRL